MDYRIHAVIVLMRRNLARRMTLTGMARAAEMSPSHFCRLFKNETNRTPASYLKQLRMGKARELLEETTLSVKQVMARVGLFDESHFVRDFQALYGLSPARYRACHHGQRPAGPMRESKIG